MRHSFLSLRLLSIKTALLLGACLASHAQEPAPAELQKLVVAINQPSSLVTAAENRLTALSSKIKARFKAAPKSFIDDDSNLALYGDLFRTGGCFALFEISMKPESGADYTDGAVGFAEWGGSKWKLRGLWKIASVWRPKEWEKKHDGSDYLPITPAAHPFGLRDFSGDGIPEVTIAGEVDKYFQAYYLLRFDPKGHALNLLQYAMAKPELVGKYVRLHFNSGRRAIYGEWEYLQWSGEKLVPKVTWHDESPYNGEDPHFVRVDVLGAEGPGETLVITDAESDGEQETTYTVTKEEKPYAKVVFAWKKSPNEIANYDEVSQAWFFEKTTGLPRDLFPRRENGKKLARLEDWATVRVTGTGEALRRLTPKQRP